MTGPSGTCLLAPVRAGAVDWDAAVRLDVQPWRPEPPAPPLTARQQQIVNFIRHYIAAHGFSPSYREVGRGVGLKSVDAVRYQLGQLAQLGVVELPAAACQRRSLGLLRGGTA